MKVIKLDDQTGALGILIPDNIVTELGLKEGDHVELTEGPNRTVAIKLAEDKEGADE